MDSTAEPDGAIAHEQRRAADQYCCFQSCTKVGEQRSSVMKVLLMLGT